MNTQADSDVSRRQENAVWLCFALASFFAIPALIIALASRSMLLLADMLDYPRVIVTSFLGWRILRAARLGKLTGFDYGSGKLQDAGGMVGAAFYLAAMLIVMATSIKRLFHPTELVQTFTLLAVIQEIGQIAVDGWLWRRNRRVARENFSPIMETQWRADRADVLSSLAVLIGLLLTLAFRQYAWSVYLDPICASLMAAYLALSFLPTLSDDAKDLLDRSLPENLQLRVDHRLAENFDGFLEFHGVRSRRAANRVFIEIALSFPDDRPVREAVKTAESIRAGIESDIPGSEVRIALTSSDRSKGE